MRRKARFLAVLAVAVAGVGVWGGLQVFASTANAPVTSVYQLKTGKAPVPGAPVQNPTAGQTLIQTYLYQNDSGPSTGAGFPLTSVEGPDTFVCKPPNMLKGHCVLEVDKTVQVLGPAGSYVAILTFVDGNVASLTGYIDPGYFLGATDGTHFQTFTVHSDCPETTFSFCTTLKPGTHTIEEAVYTGAPSIVSGSWFEARLYGVQ
jgi:hypothetical protein